MNTPPPSLTRWTLACTAAETLGMTAAATAATLAHDLASGPGGTRLALAWLVVVLGGLVEGTALGVLQSGALRGWLTPARRRRWLLVTVLVAGLGWAAASVPGVRGEDGGAEPPLAWVLLGAAGLGITMGALLGAAQSSVLRGAVPHPWRWTGANVAAWAVAMPVIFLGATRPAADWSTPAVILTGVLTGLAGGATLGIVSGWFLPTLSGIPASGRPLLAVLRSPVRPVHRAAGAGRTSRGRAARGS